MRRHPGKPAAMGLWGAVFALLWGLTVPAPGPPATRAWKIPLEPPGGGRHTGGAGPANRPGCEESEGPMSDHDCCNDEQCCCGPSRRRFLAGAGAAAVPVLLPLTLTPISNCSPEFRYTE